MSNNNDKSEIDPKNDDYNKYLMSMGGEIGTGAVFGYASGFATRSVLKLAIVGFGLGFIALQGLQNSGFVNVEWKKLEQAVQESLDVNKDGKIDKDDAKLIYERYLKTLTYKLPSTGGFALAFLLGLRGKFFR